MNNHIVSTFSIYDRTGALICEGLQLFQAVAIKARLGCIIKFSAFVEVAA